MENINTLKVLIVSFYFPPYNKVGGRRWAKHCKYLQKENVDFRVLAGNFPGKSSWDKDIITYTDKISRVELKNKKAAYHFRKLPTNIFQKIVWKISLIKWEAKKKNLSGNYNDPSLENEKEFYLKARSILLNENINTVIVSCGPFTYSNMIPKLKKDFPAVKYVIDFRDYWEDVFTGLNDEQIKTEGDAQKQVLGSVDLILSPNKEMENFYARNFNKQSYLLPHCIDADDLPETLQITKRSNKINFIYGGAFYKDIYENIELIKNFIDLFSKKNEVEVDFYVSVKGYEKELSHPKIKRQEFLTTQLYFEKVLLADFVILILPPNRVNASSSKFYELVALRKPIVYFGNEGEVSKFITKNNLGFHITKENLIQQVDACNINLKDKSIPDQSYNISENTFEYQTKKLIEILN